MSRSDHAYFSTHFNVEAQSEKRKAQNLNSQCSKRKAQIGRSRHETQRKDKARCIALLGHRTGRGYIAVSIERQFSTTSLPMYIGFQTVETVSTRVHIRRLISDYFFKERQTLFGLGCTAHAIQLHRRELHARRVR